MPNKSTDDVLFEHIPYITKCLEEGRSVISLYLSFDIINPKIFFEKIVQLWI